MAIPDANRRSGGALRLAQQLGADRVAAVAAVSPALWLQPGDSAPGAFDDAEDFRRNDVFAARAEGGLTPGGHDGGYWRGVLPAELAFLARRLHAVR